MKKLLVALLVLLLITTSILLCSCNKEEEITYVEKPEDCALKMWILDDYNKEDVEANYYLAESGILGRDVYYDVPDCDVDEQELCKEPGVEYIFSGYPDVLDGYKLTTIIIRDPEFVIFGTSVASSFEAAKVQMKKYGYQYDSKATKYPDHEILFKKGYIQVSFRHDAITISAPATNVDEVDS